MLPHLGTDCGTEHWKFQEPFNEIRTLELAGVVAGELTDVFVAVVNLIQTALFLRPQVHGGELHTLLGKLLQSLDCQSLLRGFGGHEKDAQAVSQSVFECGVQRRYGFANPGWSR